MHLTESSSHHKGKADSKPFKKNSVNFCTLGGSGGKRMERVSGMQLAATVLKQRSYKLPNDKL